MSALPQSRKIAVATAGGLHSFRWRVGSGRGRLMGTSGPNLTLTVQATGPRHGVFQMDLSSKPYQALDDYDQEHTGCRATLGPKDVKRAIEYALENGWDPNDKKQQGAPFKPKGPLDLTEYELLP